MKIIPSNMSFLKHLIVRLPVVIENIKYYYISCVFIKIYRVQTLSKYIVYINKNIQYGET